MGSKDTQIPRHPKPNKNFKNMGFKGFFGNCSHFWDSGQRFGDFWVGLVTFGLRFLGIWMCQSIANSTFILNKIVCLYIKILKIIIKKNLLA